MPKFYALKTLLPMLLPFYFKLQLCLCLLHLCPGPTCIRHSEQRIIFCGAYYGTDSILLLSCVCYV